MQISSAKFASLPLGNSRASLAVRFLSHKIEKRAPFHHLATHLPLYYHLACRGTQPSDPPLSLLDWSRRVAITLLLSLVKIHPDLLWMLGTTSLFVNFFPTLYSSQLESNIVKGENSSCHFNTNIICSFEDSKICCRKKMEIHYNQKCKLRLDRIED